ncbi:hypothetical protein Tfer_1025 [Thermincola ferriacetica]|uniref:Threonine/Serine exporter ThrE domain-containing protein n=2 Tax=Thermincola TaxID=278993 RepID=D5X7X1_THEPJ|nr:MULTISPECIES: threonine/serine exporter family protein [Thermincola]ADG82691.1 conserved hypothetical protein [Thermincola potens JR]KNZ70156.1 hypothetical protein Tfer_1025 [Thermincola ferriacetica]
MATKMVLALITVLFTGVTLRIPPSALFTAGITGMLGWTANKVAVGSGMPELVAVVIGALVVGTLGEFFARVQKQPVTVYVVSGIIPLVPGLVAYNSMLAFLENRFIDGLKLFFQAFLIASYLATGLALPPLVVRNLKIILRRGREDVK